MGTLSASFQLAKRPKPKRRTTEVNDMKAEYDLSKMKSRRNPYASKLKKSVTMRLSEDVVQYFKGMAMEAGVPYQSLIDLYLRDCLAQNRKVEIKWPSAV
jgi:predicted DNA binding CopG/RHH family protein